MAAEPQEPARLPPVPSGQLEDGHPQPASFIRPMPARREGHDVDVEAAAIEAPDEQVERALLSADVELARDDGDSVGRAHR